MRIAVGLLVLMIVTLTACTQGGDAAPTVASVRDSAGIQIVTNPDSLPADVEHWEIDDTPYITIGAENQGPEYEFTDLGGVYRYRSGEFVVLSQDRDVHYRVYDSTGRFLRRFGRSGNGPGELQVVHNTTIDAGDTLWAPDPNRRLANLFSKDGKYVRTVDLSKNRFDIVWRHPDGSWIVVAQPEVPTAGSGVGLTVDTAHFFRTDPDGGNPKPYFTLVGTRRHAGEQFVFGGSPEGASSDSLLFYGMSDKYEISVRNLDGKLVRIIRRSIVPQPVTEAIRSANKRNQLKTMMADPSAQALADRQAWIDRLQFAETIPVFGPMQADRLGNLWVAEFRDWDPDDTVPLKWTVFGPDGLIRATISLPLRMFPDDIGANDVVTRKTDEETGLVRVVAYRIRKQRR